MTSNSKSAGDLVRKYLGAYVQPRCAVHCGPLGTTAALSLRDGGLMLWHLDSGIYAVHRPDRGQRFDVNELANEPGVSMIPERALFADFVSRNPRRIH